MYAISLYEPWATLVMIGVKQYETRSWSRSHRGPILIHASKRSDDLKQALFAGPYRTVLAEAGLTKPEHFALGAALGIVDVTDMIRTEEIRDTLTKQEQTFGNFADKRFAWKLENIRRFEHPIPMKGMQGLFEVDPYFIPMIRDEMIIWHELHGEGVEQCPYCHHVAAAGKGIVHAKDCERVAKETAK